MADLELTRTKDDRRLYALEGMGTLHIGFAGRNATVEAAGRRWQITRGFWSRVIRAIGEAGAPAGEFEPRTVRRGGTLRWGGRELSLRPASTFRERYALADGERELALFDGKGWGKRPVMVTIAEPAGVEPGLLLFTAFVVRRLADDANAAASAGATTAATTST